MTSKKPQPPPAPRRANDDFTRLVRFVREVRGDHVRDPSVASRSVVVVCDAIIEHSEYIRRTGDRQ